jgi:hypothetical protein
MNAKYLNATAFLVAPIIGLAIWLHPSIRGQEKASGPQLRTNWVGGLVIGKKEIGDRIAGNRLFPQTDAEIEIGLRSDGVVVWRKAP